MQELKEKIELDKELLSTMPRNNSKNIKKYKEKIDILFEEYSNYKAEIEKKLINRYEKNISIESNEEIANLQDRLNTIDKNLYLLSEEKTSYEKMELDKIIYKIEEYHKENLDNVNSQILECIKKFKEVGIELQLSDFNYSLYVQQYMQVFFEEMEKENINSEKVKARFEEIYWKCPDIIVHIELNIRNIYLKRQRKIDKYFENKKYDLLKKWDKNPSEIMNIYTNIQKEMQEKISTDKKLLLNEFIDKKLNLGDFTKDKVKNNCNKILPTEIVKNISSNQGEIEKNISKFLNSLYEYKNYMEFKFIVDDIKQCYKDKDKYKKVYVQTRKKIKIHERKLKKINKKNSRKLFVFKRKKQLSGQNKLVLELKDLYQELDLNKFYNKIYSNINDESTVYEVLILANSYYKYLTSCIKRNNKSIEQEEIDEMIKKLDMFLKNKDNTIINNITMLEEKNVALIIRDRYKLLNFIVEDDLNLNNVDNLISILESIKKSFCLEKSGLKLENVEEILEIKKVLRKQK